VFAPGEGPVGVATISTAAVHEIALDREVIERHRCGDDQAFDEIYQRFAEMVYNLAYRLSGSGEEASDLTQEVFLRVFRHLGSFRGGSTLKTWIFRITINHCRDRLSRWRPQTEPIEDEIGEGGLSIADPGRGPEELAVAADEGRRVSEALAHLPQPFREAVILRDIEGLAYDEIAEVLQVRVGTVRSRIARGREQLRFLLERKS
jgi:RNA polymerase sigma-70 factor (ECF subfamily)